MTEKLVNKYIQEYNKNHNSGVQEIEEFDIAHEYGKRKKGSGGVIIGTKRNKQGKLIIYQTKKQQHVLVCAGTGYGKTQGYILNTVLNLDGKSSVVIADPKGEICSLTYNNLSALYGKENVGIINFRSPENTQLRYNPFQSFAEEYYDTRNMPAKQKEVARERVITKMQTLISNMFPVDAGNSDPAWYVGARQLLFAVFGALCEDTCEDSFNTSRKSELRKLINPKDVTIANVIKVFSKFSWQVEPGAWGDLGFFSSRSENSIAKQHAKTVLGTSSAGTRTSYLSIVNSLLEAYYNPRILDITSDHTVDVLSMAHTPKILFLVYDLADEHVKKLVNNLIVDGLTLLTDEYCKTSKPLDVPVIFLCDEFSSFSPDNIFPNVLSLGRAMNIFLHLAIQSVNQLRAAYKEKADVIIENCGIKLFLGSNDYQTARNFIEEIGCSIQLSKTDLMMGKISYIEKPRINIDKALYEMGTGECFIKMMQSPPIHSNYEMFYNTPEYHKFPEFYISSIIAPKLDKQDVLLVERTREKDDAEEKRIEKARAELEKRRAEILKRMMETVDDDDDEEEKDFEDEN